MSDPEWRPVTITDFASLRETRLQLHYAAQWLARAARAYVFPQPNDGHTNLGWDRSLGALVTHPLKTGGRVGLQPTDLTLAVIDPSRPGPARRFALNGRTDAEARAWLGAELGRLGLDAAALDAPSPYTMPPHAIANGARYLTQGLSDAFAEFTLWYGNADILLGLVRQEFIAQGFAVPPVRCWPHHFDLDTPVTLGTGQPAHSMGVGFAPGDHYYDEPYFYVSLYPGPDVTTLPRLPSIGHWHARDFTGAIVPARRIVGLRDQPGAVKTALKAAIETAIRVLA